MHFVVVCLHCWWVDMLLVRLLDSIGRCLVFALCVFASYMPGKVPTYLTYLLMYVCMYVSNTYMPR